MKTHNGLLPSSVAISELRTEFGFLPGRSFALSQTIRLIVAQSQKLPPRYLSPLEQRILDMRREEPRVAYAKIGEVYGLSAERIRQIANKAQKKLSNGYLRK